MGLPGDAMFKPNDPAINTAEAWISAPAADTIDARPLRVLTVLYGFAPGGVERIAARLHAAWIRSSVQSRIIVADHRVAPPIPLTDVICAGPTSRSRGIASFVALVLAVRRHVRDDRPDVLFCAGNTYSAVLVVARLLIGRDCPPIVAKISNCLVRRDMTPPVRGLYHIWLRLQGRWIAHFVALAPAMQDEIALYTGVPHDRISVIEDPALGTADLASLATQRDATCRAADGHHFLAVGRLAPQKNFALLLDAFARIARPADRLTLLGDGEQRARLEAQVAALGLGGRVHMPGHVDPLAAWLAQADALILSSDYEGVPAVLIEALAAGLPIVSTRCCVSIDDLLEHGALGQVVPVGDVTALGAAMRAAVALEGAEVVQARRRAARLYTIDHAGGRYLALMRRVAGLRAAPAPAPRTDPQPAVASATL